MAYPQPPPGNDWSGQPAPPAGWYPPSAPGSYPPSAPGFYQQAPGSYPPSPPGFYPPSYPPPRPSNSMAIVALVSSLVIAPLGIVFGHIALSQIRRSGEEGKGLAIAGLVIGYIFTGVAFLVIVFWLVLFVVLANTVDRLPTTPTTHGTYSMQPITWIHSSPRCIELCPVND